MIEPSIIVQTADCHSDAEKRAWVQRQADYGRERGVVLGRVTAHDEIQNLILYEGWTEHPGLEQGKPRFQFTPNKL
jgi:hypothetical protein